MEGEYVSSALLLAVPMRLLGPKAQAARLQVLRDMGRGLALAFTPVWDPWQAHQPMRRKPRGWRPYSLDCYGLRIPRHVYTGSDFRDAKTAPECAPQPPAHLAHKR